MTVLDRDLNRRQRHERGGAGKAQRQTTRIDLSIGQRLSLGFGLVLALLLTYLGIFLYQDQRIREVEDQLTELIDPREDLATDVQIASLRQAVVIRNYLLTRDQRYVRACLDYRDRGQASVRQLEAMPHDADDRVILDGLGPLMERYSAAADRLTALVERGADAEALLVAEIDLGAAMADLLEQTQALIDLQHTKQSAVMAQIDQAHATLVQWLLIVSCLTLALGVSTAFLVSQSVRKPATQLALAVRALRAGDFAPAQALCPTEASACAPGTRRRDELAELTECFGVMAAALQARERRVTACGDLAAGLASSIELQPLADGALRRLMVYTGVESGAVYLLDRPNRLMKPIASYGLQELDKDRLGEGLLRQAAAEGRTVVDQCALIGAPLGMRPATGGPAPSTVVATPAVFRGEPVGGIVVASGSGVSDEAISFIEHVSQQLAVSLQNALVHLELQRLVEDLKNKNELLAVQNEELQALNEEVQAQNEELQAQNEELARQRKALYESDRSKDEFLSVASHELKGPVTSLKGFTQLLLRQATMRPELSEYSEHLRTIDRQASVLVARVNRLLDASRAKMGRLDMRPNPTDLAALVRDQVEQAQVKTSEHTIVFEWCGSEVIGNWDRDHLEQAIGNLLDNAVRYSPNGGKVQVTLQVENGEACVTVADSGIGIPQESLPKIFQPYFRHEAAKRVKADGMGVGLYITREIILAHGGRIWVESEVGKGSAFHVALPLAASSGA